MKSTVYFLVFCLCSIQTFGERTTRPAHHRTTHHHSTHHHGTGHQHSHPTRESVVIDTFNFRYDPRSHMMAAISHKKCYIYSMSATEATDVHTTHGLHTLESKLITMADDTTQKYTELTVQQLDATSHLLSRNCNHPGYTIYQLN